MGWGGAGKIPPNSLEGKGKVEKTKWKTMYGKGEIKRQRGTNEKKEEKGKFTVWVS